MDKAQNQSKNLAPLLIILAVLLVAVALHGARPGGWLTRLSFWSQWGLELEETAPAGQMIGGFPRGLVDITEDAKLIESKRYSSQAEGGRAEVLRVAYETEAGVPALFAAYIDYLADRGYSVSSADSRSGTSSIVAGSDREEVRVRMSVSSSSKSEVRIDVVRPVLQ